MKNGSYQQVQSNVAISVTLPHHYKGTHQPLHGAINVLSEEPVAASEIRQLLKELCSNLEVAEAEINLKFDIFCPCGSCRISVISIIAASLRYLKTTAK